MVKIISFDVGIKNLAYCLIEFTDNTYTILEWDVIDIAKRFLEKNIKCSVMNKGNLCNNIAINYIEIDTKKIGFCKNKKCQALASSTYSANKLKKTKIINLKNISLLELTSELIYKLKSKSSLLNTDIVVIENQPVLKNPTMKSIQMVLYSYFLIYGITTDNSLNNIALFNAGRKLDIYNGPEIESNCKAGSYTERKKLSIEYTKCLLKDNSSQLSFFIKHKKKDDLADSYLQCLSYYKKKYNA